MVTQIHSVVVPTDEAKAARPHTRWCPVHVAVAVSHAA